MSYISFPGKKDSQWRETTFLEWVLLVSSVLLIFLMLSIALTWWCLQMLVSLGSKNGFVVTGCLCSVPVAPRFSNGTAGN